MTSRKLSLRAVLLLSLSFSLVALALILFQTSPTQAASGKGSRNAQPHNVNLQTIMGNPFTIQVGADGSDQIENAQDPVSPTGGEFYPPDTKPGDLGIFLATGSQVSGPDFANHNGSASNRYDLFIQVSQSNVTGSGTSADPFTVRTVLDVPGTAIRITQTSTYVNGTVKLNQSWAFSNSGNGQPTPAFNFFYAGDIYFQGSDSGYGYYDVATGAVGGFNQANTSFIIFIPTVRSNAYFEGRYNDVWDKIGSAGTPGPGFGNSIDATTLEDNGAGLQWINRQVGANLAAAIQIGQGAAPPPLPYIYALPFIANQAGNYTSYIVFQNPGNVTANLYDIAYDANGFSVGADITCPTLAAHAECLPPNLLSPGMSGTGIIASDQPLNVVVAQATPFGGSAYAVSKGGSANLVAPLAINGSIGFTTGLTVFNAGASPTSATVKFYDASGTHITAADKTIPTIPSHASQGLYQGSADSGLPANFYGWAQITGGAGSELTAQVVEQKPSSHFVAIANAQATPQTTLYAPAMFHQAFGSFTTGANIVNPSGSAVNVTITYYNGSDGTAIPTPTFSIPAFGIALVYQGGGGGNGLPSGGLPIGFAGSALVSASGGVVMVVNEAGALTPGGFAQSGTYAAAPRGSNSVGLPVIANGGYGYVTGATILNTSATAVTANIQYYNVNGTVQGSLHPITVPPHASSSAFQGGPDQGLPGPTSPTPFYGTAIVTETGGGNDLIITTNAQSNLFFYTYTEPN